MIYLCYPNNPTGTVLTRAQLKKWVDYALQTGALILYDAAYATFIRNEDVPHSIYEIEGAKALWSFIAIQRQPASRVCAAASR